MTDKEKARIEKRTELLWDALINLAAEVNAQKFPLCTRTQCELRRMTDSLIMLLDTLDISCRQRDKFLDALKDGTVNDE